MWIHRHKPRWIEIIETNMIEHVCVCVYIYILCTIYNMNDKTDESLAAAVALSHHDEDARENARC